MLQLVGAKLCRTLALVFFILLIVCIVWIAYRIIKRYNDTIKREISKGQQLLLFKAKSRGLSDYQFKILKGITDFLQLEKPSLIAEDPLLFERSIGRFLRYAVKMGERTDSLESICSDLVITYEKLYHYADIRKPILQVRDCEINTLLSIGTEDNNRFIGKIRECGKDNFTVHIFAFPEDLKKITPGLGITVFFWRAGDAPYTFHSVITGITGSAIEFLAAGELQRGQSVPHPLINMIIPCIILQPGSEEKITADIFKMNETEAQIRCSQKLAHDTKYIIEFSLSGFAVRTDVRILRERYIADRHIFYFNIKMENLSEAAKNVVSNFITEHLFE
ncbi:MAG: hypothetical protein ACRCUT_11135 [Spirochaetota bacterium]